VRWTSTSGTSGRGLDLARRLARTDLEAQATRELAETFSTQLRFAEAKEMIARALVLAEESAAPSRVRTL